MICEIIKVPGEPGSGAGADAFQPGVHYVCQKASLVELRNLGSRDWRDAAGDMRLTSELSDRVRKPYYHLVLSWHEHEHPTDDQQVAAMDQLIRSLGLDEHQAVIGTHRDTPRCHIHAVINTVHPLAGAVWSKSKDHERAELACRQIELDQGWSHDRGHFDFAVVEAEGRKVARLLPKPAAHWDKVKADREAGRRKKTASEIKVEKRTGFETFDHAIPDALRTKVQLALGECRDWPELHSALDQIGLRYERFGSGARVHLVGSTEFAKASSFGAWFSLGRMEKAFGVYVPPAAEVGAKEEAAARRVDKPGPCGVIGELSPEAEKASRAAAFKLTLLRRTYVGIHLDPRVAAAIRSVHLAEHPPRISFRDGATVLDHGPKLTASDSTGETRATMIAMAKAKGWTTLRLTGEPDYIRRMSVEAAAAGLRVTGVPADVQAEADKVFMQWQTSRSRIDRVADAAETAHLEDQADREAALAENAAARQNARALKQQISAEARAVIAAITAAHDPAALEKSHVVREARDRLLDAVGDARSAPSPQPAPDAALHDRSGTRRIRQQLRANDAREIDELKRIDIGLVATTGGWSDVSASHPDSSDRHGRRFRIYRRGDDTIKCSLSPAGTWLWTSNKSGKSGSVFDLWLADNPGRTFGHARAALRALAGTAPVPVAPCPAVPDAPDHTTARQRWEAAALLGNRMTYAEARGISRATLNRFASEVRCGPFGGILVAHRDLETGDIRGFEQRWEKDGEKNKARFAKGGRKSLSIFGQLQSSTRLVVCESGLDALALAEIEHRTDTLYVSTGGGFGPETERALAWLADGRAVLGAFDNDPAGEAMHKRLLRILPEAQRLSPPKRISGTDRICKDWLDVLNAMKGARVTFRLAPTTKSQMTKSEEQARPYLPIQPADDPRTPEVG